MSDEAPAEEQQQQHDWSAYWDPEGHIYYYNSVTGESAWDAPEQFNPPPPRETDVLAEEVAEAEEPTEQPKPGAAATGSWTAHKTEDGQVYYYNADTNETTWDRPESFVGGEEEGDLSPQRQESPSTGAVPTDVDDEIKAAHEMGTQAIEEEEEVVEEVDPAVLAEEALKRPDAIMERGMYY